MMDSMAINGGCPAFSAQGSLTIRLPLASLSVSLAEARQLFVVPVEQLVMLV